MVKALQGRGKRMGWYKILRELVATLIDAWECADLRERLASWWEVAIGKTAID